MRSGFDFKQCRVGSAWGPMDGLPHREIKDNPPAIKRPDKKFVPPEKPDIVYVSTETIPGVPLWLKQWHAAERMKLSSRWKNEGE